VAFLRKGVVGSGEIVILGLAEVQTGHERVLARVANRRCYAVRWSPDGRRIAMNEAYLGNVADESYIDLIEKETGDLERLSLTQWKGPYTAVAWLPEGRSFLVGQAADVLAHVSGSMGQIMQYDLESGTCDPLFWSAVNVVPMLGWNTATLTILNANQVVLDELHSRAELREVSLSDSDDEPPVRVLTRGLGHDRQPAFSPDGNKVIFSSNRSGNVDLWIVDRITSELRQLTDDPADDWDPAFTPDGEHVLWSSNRSGNMEIWMATAAGSHARQVTQDGIDAENPTMTRDGKWIVYSSSNDEKLGIWKIHADGSEATRLIEGTFALPEVSPDGRYALFSQILTQSARIQVVEVESGELIPFGIEVTPTARWQNSHHARARWTEDGRSIVYIGQDRQGRFGVFAQDFAPGQDTLVSRKPLAGFSPDFVTESLGISSDGQCLVISARFDIQSLKLAEGIGLLGWE
jgi:TolB protein